MSGPVACFTRALALLLVFIDVAAGKAGGGDILVTIGEVTPTTARLWLRAPDDERVTVEFGSGEGRLAVTEVPVRPDVDLTAITTLAELRPNARYRYAVRGKRETVRGEFLTAPEGVAPVTFLWSGDLGGGNSCRPLRGGYPIFRQMASRRPDFFLFVGDTVYADRRCYGPGQVGSNFEATSLKEYRAKHRYNREDIAVQAFFRQTAVYAIWDDHEVRNDFAGPTETLMPVGRQAFLDYWPIAPPPDDPTRLYRRFRWGGLVEVFILDTRQYRAANTEPDGPGKTMLGAAQRRWLVEGVGSSTARWKIVVSSVSLSVPTGRPAARDSWSNANVFGFPEPSGTGFARERDAILAALRERGVRNLVVLTADAHHAELIRHRPPAGVALHEFIAGPLSATLGRPRPLDHALRPESIFAAGGIHNFGEVTVDDDALTVRIIDEAGTVLFTHAIRPEW